MGCVFGGCFGAVRGQVWHLVGQALILDGWSRCSVVSFGGVSGLPGGQVWHLVGVIWASVGPMKGHDVLMGSSGQFGGRGVAEKGSKKACPSQTGFTHFSMVFLRISIVFR